MDQSFDQFAGGGWTGEQGDQDFNSRVQKTNIYDKLIIPASIEDLVTMSDEDGKYILGDFSFNTLRVMGKVVNVHTDTSGCTTYEVCDAFAPDQRIAKRFVILWHPGDNKELQHTIQSKIHTEGQVIRAIGKLRPFNNQLSLVSFHIFEAKKEEIEIYKQECKLAKYYFEKRLVDQSHGLEKTVFRTALQTVQATPARPETAASGGYGYHNTNTPCRASNSRPQLQNRPAVNQQQPNNPQPREDNPDNSLQHLNRQQRMIYDFVLRYGDTKNGGNGVHIEQIRQIVRADHHFENDMQYLQDDGKIYTTVDDEHFSIVTNT